VNRVSSFATVGVPISPDVDVRVGVSMSPGAAAQGGVGIWPGSGGAQGGVRTSPAMAVRLKANVKTRVAPSLLRFFMFSP
jgi:hypothetical protein